MTSSSTSLPLPPDAAAHLAYERFVDEVSRRQLAEWLPSRPSTILDLSVGCPRLLSLMVARGHRVVHVAAALPAPDIEPLRSDTAGAMLTVEADGRVLDWVATGTVDAVVAEGSVLSDSLAAELTVEDIHRVLRPGGAVLLSVDSLVAGLSRLADQGRWAELADVPSADVVLVPGTDGSVSRCFWTEELHGMLDAAGFDVDWVRPRTVLAEDTVARALQVDPGRLDAMVTTELALAVRRQGESIGNVLVASGTRR